MQSASLALMHMYLQSFIIGSYFLCHHNAALIEKFRVPCMIHIEGIGRYAVRFQVRKKLIVIGNRTNRDVAGLALLPCFCEVHIGSFLSNRLVHLRMGLLFLAVEHLPAASKLSAILR